MQFKISSLLGGLMLTLLAGNVFAEDIVSQIETGCATEIKEYWYVARVNENVKVDRLLADARVLMPQSKKVFENDNKALVKFIIITNDDLTQYKKDILSKFIEMKRLANLSNEKNLEIELWDKDFLSTKEKELGIYL